MELKSLLKFCYFFVITLCSFHFVKCGEYCITDNGRQIEYCDHGCCGDDYDDKYCCTPIVWIVVGCVLGAIFIAAVIIVIVCIFYKSKGKSGRVIQPQQNTATVTYTTSHVNQGVYVQPTAPPQYGFNYGQPPPYSQPYGQPYGQPLSNQSPPSYPGQQPQQPNNTDPAYPPPAPAQYNN